MVRDTSSKFQVTLLSTPQDHGGTEVKSSLVDMSNKRGVTLVLGTGVVTGEDGSNYVTPVIQHSDTTVDGDFAAVETTDIVGGVLPVKMADAAIQKVGYIGSKRYVRVFFDHTGTGVTVFNAFALAVQETEEIAPATNPAAIAAT